MLTSAILVMITLVAGVIGTIYNPTPKVKGMIVLLAVCSAAAALFKEYDNFRDQQFNRGALAALLSSSSSTPEFRRAVEGAIVKVAREHDLIQSFTTIKDRGAIYAFHRKGTRSEDVIAIFAMTNEDRAAAFLKFVANEGLDSLIESAMFAPEPQALGEAWEMRTERLLEHFGLIGNIALNQKASWMTPETMISTTSEYDPLRIEVTADNGKQHLSIALDKDFIIAIRTLPPVERDGKAYAAFINQIK